MGVDLIAAGRSAMESADWEEARERFAEAVAHEPSGPAYEELSQAAWWLGDEETTLGAREQAFHAYRADGDRCSAARMAMWLAVDHLDFRGDDAISAVWLRRGRELLYGHPPCPELGFLDIVEADHAHYLAGDPRRAGELATRALTIARETEDRGVEVVALATLGAALLASGAVDEGLKRFDEAMTLVVTEQFPDQAAPGWALCHTVSACTEIGEYSRAEQWCRILHSSATNWNARMFFGTCRSAYGEILTTAGEWRSAEQELASAVEDLNASRQALASSAVMRLGRLRLRQGDLEEARRMFESALPQPGAIVALGEMDLAAGQAAAARDAAERALRRVGPVPSGRLPALLLLAEASAALGEEEAAAEAIEQAAADAERLGTPYMRARMIATRARVSFAAGRPEPARLDAEDAIDLFTACGAPFEAAEVRQLLGEVLGALGQGERAAAEIEAAKRTKAMLAGGTSRPQGSGGGARRASPHERFD